jgi:hypothetical protein
MATDKFTFFADHYADILQLVQLNTDIEKEFPVRLGSLIEDVFKDTFSQKFAGVSGWEYDNRASSDDSFCFWHPDYCPGGNYGPYFSIYPLSAAAEIIDVSSKGSTKSLVHCEVIFEHPERNRRPIRYKNLVAAASKDRKRLEGAGLIVSQDLKLCRLTWVIHCTSAYSKIGSTISILWSNA